MRGVLVAVVLLAFASTASAGPNSFAGIVMPSSGPPSRGLSARPTVPAVTKLHPVIGSVQRTGHFTNPFTHRTKYTGTVYNPILGQFGTHTFRG